METPLLPRHLRTEIETALRAVRIVNVIGPRQAGKTTLVRDLLGTGRFITLDDTGVLAAVEADPYGQMTALAAAAGDAPVIIDEVQRSRSLAISIKRIVDEQRRPGQFLLTGSSNVFATASVADSLAGRVQTLTLLPLSAAEIHIKGPAMILDWASGADAAPQGLPQPPVLDRGRYIDLLIRGGYPEVRALPDRVRNRRYRDVINAIVERDVADVLKVRKSDALRRVIDQLAARTAEELSVEALCAVSGIQRATFEQYVDVLTSLGVLTRLGAWASGATKREIRRPKVHFLDCGVVAALRGFDRESFGPHGDPVAFGHLVETFVFTELTKSIPFQSGDWRLWHWRNQDGREVDFVAECGNSLVAVEVKASSTLNADDVANLRWFKSQGPGRARNVTGIAFYLGDQVLSFGDRLFAIPLSMFWAWPHIDPEQAAWSDFPVISSGYSA